MPRPRANTTASVQTVVSSVCAAHHISTLLRPLCRPGRLRFILATACIVRHVPTARWPICQVRRRWPTIALNVPARLSTVTSVHAARVRCASHVAVTLRLTHRRRVPPTAVPTSVDVAVLSCRARVKIRRRGNGTYKTFSGIASTWAPFACVLWPHTRGRQPSYSRALRSPGLLPPMLTKLSMRRPTSPGPPRDERGWMPAWSAPRTKERA
jgi:hypothetical protein